jgi:hypothetical protein
MVVRMSAPADPQKLIAEMDGALHTMLDENEALRAERDQLRAEVKRLVDWITGDRDALVCLQSIYNDPSAPENNRIKAASAAIGYERPKLTFGVQISGPAVLGERLDQGRTMKTVNQPPLIEHQLP